MSGGAPASAPPANGYIGAGANDDDGWSGATEDTFYYGRWTTHTEGQVSYIHIIVRYTDALTNAALYTDAGVKLSDAAQIQGDGSSSQTMHFTLDTPVTLSASTVYILGVVGDDDTYWSGRACWTQGDAAENEVRSIAMTGGATLASSFNPASSAQFASAVTMYITANNLATTF